MVPSPAVPSPQRQQRGALGRLGPCAWDARRSQRCRWRTWSTRDIGVILREMRRSRSSILTSVYRSSFPSSLSSYPVACVCSTSMSITAVLPWCRCPTTATLRTRSAASSNARFSLLYACLPALVPTMHLRGTPQQRARCSTPSPVRI